MPHFVVMEIVDDAQMPPGACFLTGHSSGPFIDTGIDFDDLPAFGRAYVAYETVADMAQKFGMVRKDTHQRNKAETKALRERLAVAEAALDAERKANAALRHAGYNAKEHANA